MSKVFVVPRTPSDSAALEACYQCALVMRAHPETWLVAFLAREAGMAWPTLLRRLRRRT